MKVEFLENNEGYQEIIEMLHANHPEYESVVSSSMSYAPQSENNFVAKIGNRYYEAKTPKELYMKIVDHGFHIPHSFIG